MSLPFTSSIPNGPSLDQSGTNSLTGLPSAIPLLFDKDPLKRKLLCLEVNPPRGVDVEQALERAKALKQIDFVNITDSALAKMRMSGLMFASLFKNQTGIETLVNLSCRDRNVIGLQSELLGAWALGIRSIVALTGDAVTVGDLPEAKGVFEINSIGLLSLISSLNGGKDLAGTDLKGRPSFISGVVCNPNARNTDAELKRLQRKRDSGATYVLSQPVFDKVAAREFFERASKIGIHLFVGLLPFKTERALEGILKVPGIKAPEDLVARVKGESDEVIEELSMATALAVAESCEPYVTGFHVIAGGSPKLAVRLCERLALYIDTGSVLPSSTT